MELWRTRPKSSGNSGWDDVDLAGLEAEVFVCGAWSSYANLEDSISMPELILTVDTIRKEKHEDRKFAAAMKGVDLDENSEEDPLAKARKRVASREKGLAPDDIVANPDANINALGMNGLGYEVIDG